MIGKPEWFKYRVFGWGIAPKTWQGWVYIAVFAAIVSLVTAVQVNLQGKIWIYGIVIGILVLDVLHIMANLPRTSDERENYHQLIIERNCSFAAVAALAAIALYQAVQNKTTVAAGQLPFDTTILIVLGAMLSTKIISTIYVRTKM
jgi:hypothetical protein